ncbi:MAG: RNA 2',3'-cyclic phosphodiesterase [Candidatus Aenigmatarchaeota archaeon]
MRCFLGTKLDGSLIPEVSRVKDGFTKINADIKPVLDENLHFTVKFLGEIKQGRIKDIDVMKEVLEEFQPFKVELKGVGAFPSKDYIKVLWIGAGQGKKKFRQLMKRTDGRLGEEGFEEEKNKPVPHITVGRVKSGRNKGRIQSKIRKWEGKEFGKMMVEEVTLFESELKSEGPVYKKIKDYRL